MKLKIFYAWQSDTSTILNRHFIHGAIEGAITQLNAGADISIEDAPAFEIDHDTKDVPGSPVVAEEICKKIDDCAIFIADVSLVAKYAKADGTTTKWTPNPNVLIELGFARRAKGTARILTVMNIGTPAAGKATDLPFDLAHLRHPIQYKLTDPKNEEKMAEKRSELVDAIAIAINTALKTVIAEEKKERQADQIKAAAAAQERTHAIRTNFENNIRNNGFYGLTAEDVQPILAISIIPLTPVEGLDVVKRRDDISDRLIPLNGIGGRDFEVSPGSLRSFSHLPSAAPKKVRDTIVEIQNDGSIFAAEALQFVPSKKSDQAPHIKFFLVEYEISRRLEGYLHCYEPI